MSSNIKEVLSIHPELKKDLFIRGFLITDKKLDTTDFPFYGNWKVEEHQGYYFMAHEKTGMHILDKGDKCFFIMGHAYNPFTMEIDEKKELDFISEKHGTDEYLERISDLTGVFVMGDISEGKINFLVDPSGMQSACCGKVEDNFYISSHPQLIGDINGLEMDPWVAKLIKYKWYGRIVGPYLPGDLTPFSQIKRIVPSMMYHFDTEISHERYWPLKDISLATEQKDYDEVIKSAADILKNNITLISQKWTKPWISLTGGIDSNTTFAAGNGIYDKFETFSYISAEKEVPDTEAAKKISARFNVKHNIFKIPDTNEEVKDFDAILAVLRHNNSYIADPKHNEARKRMVLRRECKCDVEVKSWVSETIRAYWYKYYGRKKMPKLSPKLYRNLYKIFTTNRKLAHEVDKVFEEYIAKFDYDKIPSLYHTADMHYNEVTWGSWGSLNISEMKYCFDITFIYNNRRFFDLLFRVPLEKRITDRHHLDMKKYLNKDLYDMNIRVVNMKETKFRAFALNVIFTINSILP